MKTGSKHKYCGGFAIFLTVIRYVAATSLISLAVLTCYTAIGEARRGGSRQEKSASPQEIDRDAEYLEKRSEFLTRFFGTGADGVSVSDYKTAAAAARALPRSPLFQGRNFTSAENPQAAGPWTSPISPPIHNSYGGNASARIQALAIDPINPNVVYTGSFGGLAKTTDGGQTWRYLSDSWTSQTVVAITVNPNASTDLYVGTGRESFETYGVGLYRSFDGGLTWSSPLGGNEFANSHIAAIAIDPNTSGAGLTATLYVANGGTNTCGLWRSTDSGGSWTHLRYGPSPWVQNGIYDVAIDPSTHPSTLYITEDDGTFKSTDSGVSWTGIHSVLQGSANRLSVVNGTVYLLGPGDSTHNLYKSADRGASWNQISTACFAAADSCANENNIGFTVFAVDPFNPNTIVAGNQGLYRTNNGGLSWTEIGHWWGPTIHSDHRVIAFSRTVAGVIYDGNDGGVVTSVDGGNEWTNLNQNLPGALLYSVGLSQDGSMIAGTLDNGVVFSREGASWNMIFGGDSNHNLIDPIGNTWAYYVIYTPDSFTRFNRQTGESTNISPSELRTDAACNFFPTFNMNSSQPNHLVAACQHVVRTLDATGPRVIWTTIGQALGSNGNYVTAASEAPSNSDVIYAVREYDTVFVTSNAQLRTAAVWTQVTQKNQPGGIHAVTVDPFNYQTAYLAADSGVYKTTDMGGTWVQQSLPNLGYHDVAIDPANPQHIFAACNAGVLASIDGGATWANLSDGIPAGMAVTGLSLNAINRELVASTYGRGVYTLNLGPAARPTPTPRPSPTPRPR